MAAPDTDLDDDVRSSLQMVAYLLISAAVIAFAALLAALA